MCYAYNFCKLQNSFDELFGIEKINTLLDYRRVCLRFSNQTITEAFAEINFPIKFEAYDPKPELNNMPDVCGIPYERTDCSTIALTKLLGLDYDTVLKKQLELSKQLYMPTNCDILLAKLVHDYGYTYYLVISESFQPKVLTFCLNHLKGRYCICTGNHMFTYIDGTIYDMSNGSSFENDTAFQLALFSNMVGFFTNMPSAEI